MSARIIVALGIVLLLLVLIGSLTGSVLVLFTGLAASAAAGSLLILARRRTAGPRPPLSNDHQTSIN
jgi:hypothetical protein